MKVQCILKSGKVICRVGGGQYPFEEWVPFNHRIFERAIVINMINSQQTLEYVLGQMIENKKIAQNLYPLTKQTTGTISDPERERNASPTSRKSMKMKSPSRFAQQSTSPRRSASNENSPMSGAKIGL